MTKSTLWSRMVVTGTLAGGLVLASNGTARADRNWRDDCRRRLDSDRARIDRDAARHGENSRQVSNDVARMDNDRRWCRNHKADWDHNHYDMGFTSVTTMMTTVRVTMMTTIGDKASRGRGRLDSARIFSPQQSLNQTKETNFP